MDDLTDFKATEICPVIIINSQNLTICMQKIDILGYKAFFFFKSLFLVLRPFSFAVFKKVVLDFQKELLLK